MSIDKAAITDHGAEGVKFRDLSAYIEGGFLTIGDSQDEVVFDLMEAAALKAWLNKMELP